MNWQWASYFAQNEHVQDYKMVEKMNREIQKLGGILHFTIYKESDGWHAECGEIPGIITGGSNPNPPQEEIERNIRDAIHAVFNISSQYKAESSIRNVDAPGYKLSVAGK